MNILSSLIIPVTEMGGGSEVPRAEMKPDYHFVRDM